MSSISEIIIIVKEKAMMTLFQGAKTGILRGKFQGAMVISSN